MSLSTTLLRRLGAAAGLTLATGLLAACGGDAPTDASVEDFCDSINPAKALAGVEQPDPEASEDEQKDAIQDALEKWRDDLEETGTPKDMPDDARDGYEEILEQMGDIDYDQDLEELVKQLDELDEDSDEAKALEEYVEENCDISF